tara:strand:- start:223 stop:483 length:261 start_codon:yes stop_codon:yes gene_type:complete
MTRKELRELIRSTIKEYTGTGSSGGNATDGNNVTSPRIGGSFKTEKGEMDDYNSKNAGEGGQGLQTRGMEKTQSVGNPNRTRFTRM